jgi:hypothetical protein
LQNFVLDENKYKNKSLGLVLPIESILYACLAYNFYFYYFILQRAVYFIRPFLQNFVLDENKYKNKSLGLVLPIESILYACLAYNFYFYYFILQRAVYFIRPFLLIQQTVVVNFCNSSD